MNKFESSRIKWLQPMGRDVDENGKSYTIFPSSFEIDESKPLIGMAAAMDFIYRKGNKMNNVVEHIIKHLNIYQVTLTSGLNGIIIAKDTNSAYKILANEEAKLSPNISKDSQLKCITLLASNVNQREFFIEDIEKSFCKCGPDKHTQLFYIGDVVTVNHIEGTYTIEDILNINGEYPSAKLNKLPGKDAYVLLSDLQHVVYTA